MNLFYFTLVLQLGIHWDIVNLVERKWWDAYMLNINEHIIPLKYPTPIYANYCVLPCTIRAFQNISLYMKTL